MAASSFSQDLIDFSDADADDGDDVSAILAALQARKEKQQKLKKSIRDRANKSQKQIKDESEAPVRAVDDILHKLNKCQEDLLQIQQNGNPQNDLLPALPAAPTREEDDEIAVARAHVVSLATALFTEEQDGAHRFKKTLQRFRNKLEANEKRAKNENILESLDKLKQQVEDCVKELKPL